MFSASWLFFIHKFEHQCIVLLERGATENVHLGEELEARDNEQKRILAELDAKIESSANFEEEQASGKRKKEDPCLSAVSRKYIGFLLTMIAWFVVTCVHVEGIFYVLSSMALLESVIFALIGRGGRKSYFSYHWPSRSPVQSESIQIKKRGCRNLYSSKWGVGISLLFIWELWEYVFFDLKRYQKWLFMWEVKKFTLQCTGYDQN